MKKISTFIFFLFVTLVVCCKSEDKVVYKSPEFNEIVKRSVTILGDTIDSMNDYTVTIDSFLILEHESLRNEQFFHVYNRFTGKYILSFGNKGRGYGELLSTAGISMDYEHKSMYVGTMNQVKATVFALDSLGYGKVRASEKRLKEPLSSTGLFKIKPGYYLTIYNPYNRFALYDNDMNVVDTCNFYSPIITGMSDRELMTNYYLYTSNVKVKPDGSKFFNMTACGSILEIFNIEQNKITHLSTSYFYQPTYNKFGDPLWNECTIGIRASCATDKYIYILFNGTKDDRHKIEKVSVIDWEGNLVKQYDLGLNLKRIHVDEDLGIGYVTYQDSSYEFHIGTFDL